MNPDVFQNTIQKTDLFLKDIENKFGFKQRNQSYHALRIALHLIRDRLPIDSAVSFGAQLPMLVRGFYYEGWRPEQVPIKMGQAEFIDKVVEEIDVPDLSAEQIFKGIVSIIYKHVDSKEVDKIKGLMPKDVARLFES